MLEVDLVVCKITYIYILPSDVTNELLRMGDSVSKCDGESL